jgi:hypothetical protein
MFDNNTLLKKQLDQYNLRRGNKARVGAHNRHSSIRKSIGGGIPSTARSSIPQNYRRDFQGISAMESKGNPFALMNCCSEAN